MSETDEKRSQPAEDQYSSSEEEEEFKPQPRSRNLKTWKKNGDHYR